MSEHHDDHAVHPASAAITVLVIAALFGFLFSLMGGGWVTPVIVTALLLAAWGLLSVLVLDKE
jgi:hypothetical protein